MTLLVALRGKDGLVCAADSRGTFGDPRGVTAQNDSQQKVHIISKHAALLAAGAGEVGAQQISEVADLARQRQVDGATNVLDILRQTARSRCAEWFPHLPPAVMPGTIGISRPELAFIVAGYDADAEGKYVVPRIYQTLSQLDFPPMLHEYGFAISGVAQYALYLLNRLYEADRSLNDLAALAVYVITETASQDGKVGGPVRVITISPEAGGVLLTEDGVKAINEKNLGRAAALRQSFYTSPKQGT
jgi:20S proteasome alpha/beta subunit